MLLRLGRLTAHPHAPVDFDTAVHHAEQWADEPGEGPLNPLCRPILLHHGAPTPWAVLLLHGFTNCPHQFRLLGENLHADGANVLIPRLPAHGLADRLTTAQERVTAEALTACAERAFEIAAGLGQAVVVMGLSGGGSLAAWLATQRPIARAVLIAPLFGGKPVPTPATGLAARLLLTIPNRYVWWGDPATADEGQTHAYPRWSSRAMGQFLRVGLAVAAGGRRQPPRARQIALVLNENDAGVNNRAALDLIGRWQALGVPVRTHIFRQALGLDHDVIDPTHPLQNTALVYPILRHLALGNW